ncbi:hypothetical protein [Streptomyces africanus]|uniref:hypothetical protein n=1 Tax=Streptomyces africanus TaxID=231024 RepID=UPI00117D6114|nr:hypothetical protein [Streptomyces africanus]
MGVGAFACGRKVTDDPWERIEARGWDQPRESRPHLYEDCQSRSAAAQQQTEADERERQEQDAASRSTAEKAGGCLSRFRT